MSRTGTREITAPHQDLINGGGHRFGSIRVSVDIELGDCMMTCDAHGYSLTTKRFHSIDELRGAYQNHFAQQDKHQIHKDAVRALTFAGKLLAAKEKRK